MPLQFYRRDTATVARDLLGRVLCRRIFDGTILRGRIVEVEAYHGITDQACHTFGGRRTPRTETMWGEAGLAYVYLIYGMHDCLNAVTRGVGHPEAVLIRALEPLSGDDFLSLRLPHLKKQDWLKGPGRLCKAFEITRAQNGHPLDSGDLWIEEGKPLPNSEVATSARIGVAYAGTCALKPLRFFERDSAFVSGSKKLNQGSESAGPRPANAKAKSTGSTKLKPNLKKSAKLKSAPAKPKKSPSRQTRR